MSSNLGKFFDFSDTIPGRGWGGERHFSLASVEVSAPYLAFAGTNSDGATDFSAAFGWSRVVIV